MGLTYEESVAEMKRVPYTIEKGDNGVPRVQIDDRKYSPQEISAVIIQKMKKTAEDFVGHEIKDAVITVPAYFNDAQRQATKEAGEIAGLNVMRIINEPTAAALAYGLDKKEKDMKIAVFDLGGGTFDISVLEIGGTVFEVKSTNGDTHLGGDDFDQKIIDFLADEFKKDEGVDLRQDPMTMQRLKEAAEKAKIELSTSTQTEVNLPYIAPVNNIPKHLVKTITRAKFEALCSDLIDRAIKPCQKALQDAGMTAKDIDEVILVGGMTRMPRVVEAVAKLFGKEPHKGVNPDEVVAIGAAIQGGVLTGDVKDVLLLDVTPLSIGLETMGGVSTKMIEANTTIPTKKSERYTTAADNQDSVELHLVQGERPMAKDNRSLGRFVLDGILPAPKGVPKIEVTIDIDVNGILHVTAVDQATKRSQKIRIEAKSGLSDAEIKRMKQDAEDNADADKKELEEAERLNAADALIFSTERQLKEFADKLSDDEKSRIKSALDELKSAREAKVVDEITSKTSALNSIWSAISTEIYNKQQQQAAPADATADSEAGKIEDVPFTEVKD
jgi:molecular chaperone DnaK